MRAVNFQGQEITIDEFIAKVKEEIELFENNIKSVDNLAAMLGMNVSDVPEAKEQRDCLVKKLSDARKKLDVLIENSPKTELK